MQRYLRGNAAENRRYSNHPPVKPPKPVFNTAVGKPPAKPPKPVLKSGGKTKRINRKLNRKLNNNKTKRIGKTNNKTKKTSKTSKTNNKTRK